MQIAAFLTSSSLLFQAGSFVPPHFLVSICVYVCVRVHRLCMHMCVCGSRGRVILMPLIHTPKITHT